MTELCVTRFVAAPPEKVWEVLAHRQEEWWCPKPWRMRIDRQEKRAGGACDMTMLGPDGEEMPGKGIYVAWEEGRMFASTDAVTADLQPTDPFMIGIWQIEPDGEGTRYTARARHWSDEARKQHEDMGFIEGWKTCADQLAALCEE